MTMFSHAKLDPGLTTLLDAIAAEAQPLLAEHRTGRIVINFSGGDKVRIEVSRFRDVSTGAPVKAVTRPHVR